MCTSSRFQVSTTMRYSCFDIIVCTTLCDCGLLSLLEKEYFPMATVAIGDVLIAAILWKFLRERIRQFRFFWNPEIIVSLVISWNNDESHYDASLELAEGLSQNFSSRLSKALSTLLLLTLSLIEISDISISLSFFKVWLPGKGQHVT